MMLILSSEEFLQERVTKNGKMQENEAFDLTEIK